MLRRFLGRPGNKKSSEFDESLARAITQPLRLGISLKHLASLPIDPNDDFNALCRYVKEVTKGDKGYCSYTMHLLRNPLTRHLVSLQPEVFISYAWSGRFGVSMAALLRRLPQGQDDVFVWMDVALVDQHIAATTNIDFEQWAHTFGDTLRWIGKAFLLLTPGKKPIAVSRSWCCFEMYCIKQTGIAYVPCMTVEDEEELIQDIRAGKFGFEEFNTLFAAIDVENATAFKDSDRLAIKEMMLKFGIVAVNDVVMLVVKKWMVSVAQQTESRETEGTSEMAVVLSARGELHRTQGELDLALPYFRRALANAKAAPNNADVGVFMNNLAGLLVAQSQFEEAELLYRESISISKERGKANTSIAISISNLASLLHTKENYADAEPLFREALAIHIQLLGKDHTTVATDLNNLAATLQAKGDIEDAEALYRESLEIDRRNLGDGHPKVALHLGNLGNLLQRNKKDLQGAELLYRESLQIRRKVLGNYHPSVAVDLDNLASLLEEKGEYSKVEPLYRESVEINGKVFGEDHPKFALSLGNLAGFLADEHREMEAKPLFEKALKINRHVLGENHRLIGNTLDWLAVIEKVQGNLEEARRLGREAISIYESALGPNHPDTVQVRAKWT